MNYSPNTNIGKVSVSKTVQSTQKEQLHLMKSEKKTRWVTNSKIHRTLSSVLDYLHNISIHIVLITRITVIWKSLWKLAGKYRFVSYCLLLKLKLDLVAPFMITTGFFHRDNTPYHKAQLISSMYSAPFGRGGTSIQIEQSLCGALFLRCFYIFLYFWPMVNKVLKTIHTGVSSSLFWGWRYTRHFFGIRMKR